MGNVDRYDTGRRNAVGSHAAASGRSGSHVAGGGPDRSGNAGKSVSGGHYEFDPGSFRFRRRGWHPGQILHVLAAYLLSTLALLVVLYGLFALFFNTDTEKRLKRENAQYAARYAALQERQALLEDVTDLLRHKDDGIYRDLFHAPAPQPDGLPGAQMTMTADSIPDSKMVRYAASRSAALLAEAGQVESAFAEIFRLLAEGKPRPPLELPVKGVGYAQMGAGVGPKVNPFYKATLPHDGLDFIAAPGADVLAPAGGYVTEVQRSRRGKGNWVRLQHAGGFETEYAHLSAISVSKGQYVSKGRKIGEVGMSGSAFAPHLHYSVRLDGQPCNPVHYFFASVGPEEYVKMCYMVSNTQQSMD